MFMTRLLRHMASPPDTRALRWGDESKRLLQPINFFVSDTRTIGVPEYESTVAEALKPLFHVRQPRWLYRCPKKLIKAVTSRVDIIAWTRTW
jgi:hypothetical protein